MKRFILITLAALSFSSCTDSLGDDVKNCGNAKNVPYENFLYCSQLKEIPTKPIYVLINSNEDLQKQFAPCDPFGSLPDFTQKRVLGLFSGPKPSSGYDLKIESVIEDDCQIQVQYSEKEPDDELVLMAITYPADYILLPKSNKPIFFSKVNKVVDYVIAGTYVADPSATQCAGDCNAFYKMENHKVTKYLTVNNFPAEFNQTNYKTLIFKDDFVSFLSKIPTEIKNLKGQTKTYGTPGTDNHGGVYLEWSQGGVITKVYLDNVTTSDQSAEIVAFKKVIQDKVTELKTKS